MDYNYYFYLNNNKLMFAIQNIKTKTLVIVGVVSSIVLVIIGIGIFLLLKKSEKSSSIGPSPTTIKPITPTIKPSPITQMINLSQITTPISARPKEVYLLSLNGNMIAPGRFESEKARIFPNNPNITLATVDEIITAKNKGLTVCAAGLALDEMGKEIHLLITPGPGTVLPPDAKPMCTEVERFEVLELLPCLNIWVYDVKPPKDTVGISPFSVKKWSYYDK
jgi:hypothetical protein